MCWSGLGTRGQCLSVCLVYNAFRSLVIFERDRVESIASMSIDIISIDILATLSKEQDREREHIVDRPPRLWNVDTL